MRDLLSEGHVTKVRESPFSFDKSRCWLFGNSPGSFSSPISSRGQSGSGTLDTYIESWTEEIDRAD